MSGSRFNLSALAVRERSITLFLIVLVTIAGIYAFWAWPRGRSPFYGEANDGDIRLARRNRAGDAGSGRRTAGKTPAGAQMV